MWLILPCDSEKETQTVSPLTANSRLSVSLQPNGSIALIRASMMRQARGIEVLDIVFAKNGGAGVLRGRHLSLALRFSCFFHSAITFRWAMILECIRSFSSGKRICDATAITTAHSSSPRNSRTFWFVSDGGVYPVCAPIFFAVLVLWGNGVFATGFPALSFAQYHCDGVGISRDLHTLWMATSDTLYFFATSVTGAAQTSL